MICYIIVFAVFILALVLAIVFLPGTLSWYVPYWCVALVLNLCFDTLLLMAAGRSVI